ncbi:transposase [Pseudanabaena sp. BC1403]|uniref:transposase n=1 Tax=Pseudanabaena sp. BC1403 TaxID=2043171 RepID=UPI000CD8BB8A|nr:transposase [Pseudanabaena sp. BC1403]
MKYDREKHHRRSIRLKGYDYSSVGSYFITICTFQRECLFGTISDGEMQLNQYGKIVYTHWQNLPKYHPRLELDEFVIMPNHVHGILFLIDNNDISLDHDNSVGAGLADNFILENQNPFPKPAPTNGLTDNSALNNKDLYDTVGAGLADNFVLNAGSICKTRPYTISIPAKTAPTKNFATENNHGIPEIIRGFKTFSARHINQIRHTSGIPVWQRNYHEHIIRDETSLQKIRQYIQTNPNLWQVDQLHPNNPSKW